VNSEIGIVKQEKRVTKSVNNNQPENEELNRSII